MEPLNLGALPDNALLLVDSAPVIYCLNGDSRLGKWSLLIWILPNPQRDCAPASA